MNGDTDWEQRSDGDLVEQTLAGADRAYREIVRRYQDLLYRHAERMTGRPDEAEDIVQAAFIKGYGSLSSCRNPDRVGAWLFRIAANGCKDHLKSRRRKDVSFDATSDFEAEEGNPGENLDRSELRREIESALSGLPEDQREAFVLKHAEGWSYPEISERLGVSVPALKMRVHRAREELQILLVRYRQDQERC